MSNRVRELWKHVGEQDAEINRLRNLMKCRDKRARELLRNAHAWAGRLYVEVMKHHGPGKCDPGSCSWCNRKKGKPKGARK